MACENLWDSSARAVRPYKSMVIPLEIPAGFPTGESFFT